MKNNPTFGNLTELLSHFEAETPYHLGRMIYDATECGPWLAFILGPDMPNTPDIYYEDSDAQKDATCLPCVGVKVGSIVEGSDYEIPPISLFFPFDSNAFDAAIQKINQQACDEWEEANAECDDREHWKL